MEKKIKYERDKRGNGFVTKCKHENEAHVVGYWCIFGCPHFIHDDEQPQTVTCNHPNNKPDKEDGSNDPK